MDSPGLLIAIDMISLYIILGPVVLFGFYVVFDNLGKSKKSPSKPKDLALLSSKELKFYKKLG
jgi:hypothetical protein